MHIKCVYNGFSAFKKSSTFMRRIHPYTKTHNLRYSSGKVLRLWLSTFHTMLAEVIWIGVLVSATVAALPNWPDSYGDVKIPYPFGIIEGFYLKDTASRDFSINCDTSSSKTQSKTRNVVVNTKFLNCRKLNNWKEILFANNNLYWCMMSTISMLILLQKNTLWFYLLWTWLKQGLFLSLVERWIEWSSHHILSLLEIYCSSLWIWRLVGWNYSGL